LSQILQDLQSFMGESIEITEGKQYTSISTGTGSLLNLLNRLKEVHGFNYLANLTAVDYPDHFEIVYHLCTVPDNGKIMVKCNVSRDDAVLPSAVFLWPGADWQERELFDLMGIRFQNHPNLIRILLPDDFEGHPLRKDFKIKG
jgi:NADH-quinone oxidoreductase subunit C